MLALIVATLACVSGAEFDPPPPLSPANLPPQFPPKVGATPYFWSNAIRVGGSVDDCRRKAIATLSSLNGIRYVELTPEGVVWGYTESERWTMLITPCQDACVITPILTSWYPIATELQKKVSDQIVMIAVDHKSTQKIGTRDRALEKKFPVLYWRLETRQTNSMTRNFRHFASVAALFMEKYGCETLGTFSESDKAVALGRKEGEKTQVQSIAMIELVKEKSLVLIFIGVAIDEEAAGKDVKSESNDLLKLLYE